MGTVAVVGAGQVGSRHLQALAKSEHAQRIEVLGRSPRSLQVAEERYRQVARPGRQSVLFTDRMAELGEDIDVAIIATNADTRFAVLQELIAARRVRALILEKVVFQSAAEFEGAIAALAARRIPAWVNCFRRALPAYRRLRESIAEPITLTVEGGEWGLGCNAVHYVDLCAFLSGADPVVAQSRLDDGTMPARRPGFVEFSGRIDGRCGRHRFHLVSRARSSDAARLRITTADELLLAEELGNTVRAGALETTIPYQSELTHHLVDEIVETGRSALPTLEQAYRVHAPLLELFSRHLERASGSPCVRCPIT